MVEELFAYDADQDRKIRETVAWRENFSSAPRIVERPRQPAGRPNIRGVLLDDLNSNGTAEVAVLDWVEFNTVKAVKLIGSVNGGTFTVTYNGTVAVPVQEETGDIAWDADAAEMLTALAALPSLSERVLKVDAFDGLWFIQFLGQPIGTIADMDINRVKLTGGEHGAAVIDEHWEDSGRVETVYCGIPIGTPTPLRAGAIVFPIWVRGPGYTLPGAEPRDWFDFGS